MKKFIIKFVGFSLTLLFVLFLIVTGDFLWVRNQYEQSYNASLIDKIERLKSIKEPKIILVGNSNVAFGFRSEIIEKEIGMPVVNLGLHGSLGNRFHEDIAKININNGDIVIICHSSYGDYDDSVNDYELELITLEHHRKLWNIPVSDDYLGMMKAAPSYLLDAYINKILKKGNKSSGGCYSREAFNEYGDNVFAKNDLETNYTFSEKELQKFFPQVNNICINRINDFNDYVIGKGAVLLIAGFPIADGEYTAPHSEFYEFEAKLKSAVKCPVISSVDDYFMDYSLFYNTVLHLNEQGAVIRTNQLIKDLKEYIKSTR